MSGPAASFMLVLSGKDVSGRVAGGRPAYLMACRQDDKVKDGNGIRRATALSQRSRLGRQSSVRQFSWGNRCRGGLDYAEPIVR
jgi:hypothetical protein